MNKIVIGILGILSTSIFAADTPPGPNTTPPVYHNVLPSIIKRAGGFVYAPTKGKPVRIINAQKTVSEAAIQGVAKRIADRMSWQVEVVGKETGEEGAGCVIVLSARDDAKTILVAPENAWAEVNVSPLAADKPDVGKLEGRVSKEIWRALCIALGASDSQFQPCLMRTIRTLADLDAANNEPSPEPFNAMNRSATELGFGSVRRTTYRGACREGWAPPPTNDIQRAIWEEFHTKPTKPMEIKFDKKLGK